MRFWRPTLLAVTLALSAAAAQAADTYKVDPVHSTVIFKIKHLNVANFYGRINNPAGTFVIDAADPTKSTFEVSLKADDVDTDNAKRDEHLKNADFFNAKQFPVITFKSTSVKKIDDKTLEVAGDLAMHGVTKPVTVKMEKTGEAQTRAGYRAGYEATFTVKRSDFGINYGLDSLGDEVTLIVSLEGVKS